MEAPFINVTNVFKENDDFEFDNLNPYKIKHNLTSNEENQKENTATTQMLFNHSQSIKQGNILLEGLAMKKCSWLFYQPILLVLYDNKLLSYYDPETNKLKVCLFVFFFGKYSMILKGDIILSNDVLCELIHKTKFAIIAPNKKHYFKVLYLIIYLCLVFKNSKGNRKLFS